MFLKKGLIISIVASILLLAIPVSSTITPGVYDPWIDTNNDGIINYQDLYNLAAIYGTSGTPVNKTDLVLELEARIASLEARADAMEASGSVTTDKIADGAVITVKLDDDSVTSAKILDGSITAVDLADDSIITAKIVNGAVTTSKITDGSVTTSKISNDAVVTIKMADDSVTSAKILDGTITSVDLVTGAVTSSKIADGSVTTSKIANGAVTADKIASGAVTWDSIAGKPLEIVAAGEISSAGGILTGYNIDSVTWDVVYDCYRISITGVLYDFTDYITIITHSIPTSAASTREDAVGDDLLIYIYDNLGNEVQGYFQFVTYKIP